MKQKATRPTHAVIALQKTTKVKQHALARHVDDTKASHVGSKANDKFCKWVENKCGSNELGHVTVTRGKTHDHLGTILDWNKTCHAKVDVTHCQESMCDEFLEEIKPNGKAPWNDASFNVDDDSPLLSEQKSEMFHTFVVKGMFLVERARSDLEPGFGFLSSRVKAPTKQD